MNRKALYRLAALASLLAPLVAAAPAAARLDPGAILRDPRLLARYLKLTPAQVATYRQLRGELEAKLKPLRAEQRDLYQDLREALEAASPNACSIGEIQIDIYENGEQMREALEDFDTAFSAILTPEQLARYEALKELARHFAGGD